MKPTLNATTLGIRMCSTELLFLKNLRGSTRYPMNLYKQDSIADISCNMQFFFRTSYFTKQLQNNDCKGFFFA